MVNLDTASSPYPTFPKDTGFSCSFCGGGQEVLRSELKVLSLGSYSWKGLVLTHIL